MATLTLLNPQTAAVVTHAPFETANYQSVTLTADNLATTEKVQIYVAMPTPAGTTYKQLSDTAGTAQALSATIPALTLTGGVTYSFLKDLTAGACGVYLSVGGRVY